MFFKKSFLFLAVLVLSFFAFGQTKPAAASSKAVRMESGAKVYKMYCLSCHQADAGGVPHLNPPLIKTPFVLGDKKQLIKIVIRGKTDPVTIDGEVYTNPMPPQVQLNDQQVADVLSYIRNSFGNKASMVTLAEVKNVRAATK